LLKIDFKFKPNNFLDKYYTYVIKKTQQFLLIDEEDTMFREGKSELLEPGSPRGSLLLNSPRKTIFKDG